MKKRRSLWLLLFLPLFSFLWHPADGESAGNTWQPTAASCPSPRYGHTALWTGTQMIVWGGKGASGYLNSGGRYDPVANTWQPTSSTSAPSIRDLHTAVWTGTQMIVWGGYDGSKLSKPAAATTRPPTPGSPPPPPVLPPPEISIPPSGPAPR